MIRLLLTCLLATPVAAAERVAVQMLDGTQQEGTLASMSGDRVSLKREGRTQGIELDEVAQIEFLSRSRAAEPPSIGLVTLNDGSRLPIVQVVTDGNEALARLPSKLAAADLPLAASAIRSVRFGEQQRHHDDWQRFIASAGPADLIVVYRKQGETIDAVECAIESIEANQVRVSLDGEEISLPKKKVYGVVFAKLDELSPPPAGPVVEAAGGLSLVAKSLALVDRQALRIETHASQNLTLPLQSVLQIDLTAGRLRWLDAMQPITHTWRPYFGFPKGLTAENRQPSLVANKSFTGEPLRLLGERADLPREVRHGVALRSGTETEYQIPAGFAWFYATAGIDPRTAEQGSVLLQVFADDELAYEHAVDGAGLVEVRAPLGGASRLRIVVDYGDNFDLGDRLHLGNARITR